MLNNVFIFIVALFMIARGATLATKYASRLAQNYRLSQYTVGFIIIAIISILPELLISITASLEGMPSFGLGMLFGSNIADLTLIFAIIILLTDRGLKIESKILKNHTVYPLILSLPLVLGLNGHFSRLEGIALILTGGIFYYLALRNGGDGKTRAPHRKDKLKSLLMLLFSMAVLLGGAYFIVSSATALATHFGVSPILIAMLVVALGTTIPELVFALKSAREHEDSLAVGDILGTVLADATIVVGVLALIHPFFFPQKIIYITGVFMVVASYILFRFMRSGRTVSRREAYLLFGFWVVFVIVEFFVST